MIPLGQALGKLYNLGYTGHGAGLVDLVEKNLQCNIINTTRRNGFRFASF